MCYPRRSLTQSENVVIKLTPLTPLTNSQTPRFARFSALSKECQPVSSVSGVSGLLHNDHMGKAAGVRVATKLVTVLRLLLTTTLYPPLSVGCATVTRNVALVAPERQSHS